MNRRLLSAVGSVLVRSLGASLRWRIAGASRIRRLLEDQAPVVFVLWHGAGPLLLLCRALPRVTVLVSHSADGDLATALLSRLDQGVVRGSTSRGGPLSLRRLLRALRAERRPTLTLDGPRGPRHEPAPGASHLARLGGAWVVPLGASARRGVRLNSWDRAFLPWPGSAAAIAVGRPIRWADVEGADAFDVALRARMQDAEARADRLCGRRR